MEDIDVYSVNGFFLFEVFFYNLIDKGVRDGSKRESEGGGGISEMGFESFGEVSGKRRGGEGDVEVERMREGEVVGGGGGGGGEVGERGDDMEMVGGDGGGKEG